MIPQTLSHFRVLEEIGAGGMGVVYRAHDEQLDRLAREAADAFDRMKAAENGAVA